MSKNLPNIKKCLLALDYGEKKIGWALKKTSEIEIYTFGNIKNQNDIYLKILTLCRQYGVQSVVVGDPLSENNQPNRMSQIIEKFVNKLRHSLPDTISVLQVNERYSTFQARQTFFLKSRNKNKWALSKDFLSAKVILENFLEPQETQAGKNLNEK